jgi:hypothetical protein
VVDADGLPIDFPGGGWHRVRIQEISRTNPPETVFEIVIDEGIAAETRGWSVFRGSRWPRFF